MSSSKKLMGTIANTYAGFRTNNGRGAFQFTLDDQGQRIATNSLRITGPLEDELPEILSAKRVKTAVSQLDYQVKFVEGADYRRASETEFEGTKTRVAIFKPLPTPVAL